jgi:hypothetical protein
MHLSNSAVTGLDSHIPFSGPVLEYGTLAPFVSVSCAYITAYHRAIECAQNFPDAKVTAVDINPMLPRFVLCDLSRVSREHCQRPFFQPGSLQLSIPTTRYSSGLPAMGGWFVRRCPRSLSPRTRASVLGSLELGPACHIAVNSFRNHSASSSALPSSSSPAAGS